MSASTVIVQPVEPAMVEAVSWDLTMGAVKTGLGKMFMRSMSSSSEATPDAIDHVGIIVYNRLYEFGNAGILKSFIRKDKDPIPQYPAYRLRKREILGYTKKTREEFMEWIVEAKYVSYNGATYDMVNHNCVDFGRDACEFLKVPCPPNWERICAWVKDNKKFADVCVKSIERFNRRKSSPAVLKNTDSAKKYVPATQITEEDY